MDPQIRCNRSIAKATLAHKIKNRGRITNLRTTSPSHKQIRVMERRRRTLESGVSSIRGLSTTLMACRSKQSFMVELKALESSPGSDFDLEIDKGKWIIDV